MKVGLKMIYFCCFLSDFYMKLSIFEYVRYFLILYSLPEAQEASRNLPGARGSIFPKYEPEISILDPIQLIFVNLV